MNKCLGYSRGSHVWKSIRFWPASKIVNTHQNVPVVLIRDRQWADEVHGDELSGIAGGYRLERSWGGRRFLGGCADCTTSDEVADRR